MDYFLFWIMKPLAELALGIGILFIMFLVFAGYYTYMDWKSKRTKNKKRI